ncbi:hypothetical protein F5I97DRAFT_1994531 [Phlebopus sp. FC_14]|nr:hypothetical protein F5I97DRAFT_1994531 [Phlebopus sp. FC_14]
MPALIAEIPRIIIVGAGISGIAMAVNLRTKLKYYNFVVYEKASNVGGTWRDNTYPGCGSDVPGHWYSLSTELNPLWDSYYVSQPEIQTYWECIYRKHDLLSHTVFDTNVKLVEWDDIAHVHKVTLENTLTGETTQVVAEIVISAVGGFTAPLFPKDLPGVETFTGSLWHSLHWRHDVDLKGKRVGVIGNGCSATQFLPVISAEPTTEVINFSRSPQWFARRSQYRYPQWIKWAFAHVPLLMKAYRSSIMIRVSSFPLSRALPLTGTSKADLLWILYKDKLPIGNLAGKLMTRYMRATAPAKYIHKLIPSYPPGCKRIVVDPGYLAALHRPNVSLRWDTIQEIVEDGIMLSTGEKIPLDVIIFATGFYMVDKRLSFRGLNGVAQEEYFESEGGATAYYGTLFPGFPNYFSIVGPNSGTGHASLIYSIEVQIDYILKLIRPIVDGEVKALHVKPEATTRYNVWIRKRLENTIFLSCFSYYRGDSRAGGRNVATFPGMLTLFWWITRKPRWDDFEVVGGERRGGRTNTALLERGILVVLMTVILGIVGGHVTLFNGG